MNLVSLADWPAARIEKLLALAAHVKGRPEAFEDELRGRTLLMIFQKPSLRTRVSFEAAMLQLGGHAIHYDLAMSPWSLGKETPEDTARTASRYVNAIMARLFRRDDLAALARGATVPVINGLTDFEHPCQALGDLLTIREKVGRLHGVRVAYVGDGCNNVTHSLMDGCARMGLELTVGCPRGAYSPAEEVLRRSPARVVHDPREAVDGADAVYTDTWMSYHIPAERREERMRALGPFRVTAELMARAKPGAVFLHCLPALRGMEQTAEVLDGPQSAVFDQAENRLHTEKALLLMLLG